jgi:hypothetical protein
MGALTIGRVGLDIDLDHPAKWQESRSLEERDMTVSGFLLADSVTNTKIIRSELLEQQGKLIAVTYSLDSHFDGFYILGDVKIDTVPVSYLRRGLFRYEVGLFRIGGESRVELQSNLTGTVLVNDHGLLEAETRPFVAPAIGHLSFAWVVNSVTKFTRATEDGTITVYTSDGDFLSDASWGADPATYYSGACELRTGSPLRLRSGLDVPNDPSNWQIDNGLIRVGPETGNTGRIEVECYDGVSWESLKDISFDYAAGTKLADFDFFSVSRNDPESVIVRLVSQTGASAFNRDVVDLQIRRGAPFLIGVWNSDRAADAMKVMRDTTEASTAVTPSGASGDVGVRATSNDGDGNRFIIYTPQTHTNDLTEGGVSVAAADQIRFAIGHEIGGSGAAANDAAGPLGLQYMGYFGERVRAVWR